MVTSPASILHDLCADGPVTVETYLDAALYHRQVGYYMNRTAVGGRYGDFATSATLHPALGKAIARWAAASRPSGRGRWHLIEVGAGTGDLAAAIFAGLHWWQRRRLHYHVVEISPALRRCQRERLDGRRVEWHDSVAAAVAAASGRALVISNELVDAFPCRQLVWEDGRWCERLVAPIAPIAPTAPILPDGDVAAQGRNVTPVVGAPARQTDGYTALAGKSWPDGAIPAGQIVEIHASYRRWLAEWVPQLRAGALLTIDYGDTMPALYHRRPAGTLRAYFQHQRFTGDEAFARFAAQDVTCDVNFGDLVSWGDELGLVTESLGVSR
jgi:SAM-dependent MidA family methyltransferase